MSDAVPWPFAGRVAGLIAGSHPLAGTYHHDHLASDLQSIVLRANALVTSETGLTLPGDPDVVLVSRKEWVERNIASFRHILAPAEHRLVESTDISAAVGRRMVAAETGALLGFLSRRVLGQYELVLPTGDDGDSIAFVGSNILAMERAHQLRPAEFRMWIALHEAAHRAQFLGVPWMREHFLSLVERMVSAAQPSTLGRARSLVDRAVTARRERTGLIDERGLMGLFATPEQNEVLDEIQGLMCLLEGHGHVVMDRIGARMLTSQRRMAALLKARRSDPRTAAFFRLTGLEMKVRQYELGEKFVLAVEREAGWSALDRAWLTPDNLPTASEIEEPLRWLARTG
ncbi:MAG: zinc-dependent metalloprotease [Acidimicrobiia bacterium]